MGKKKIKIKSDNYYFDFERNLLYMIGPKKWDNPNCMGYMNAKENKKGEGWEFLCLSTNKKYHMDLETMEIICTVDLGRTIPPAMRLLYGAARV